MHSLYSHVVKVAAVGAEASDAATKAVVKTSFGEIELEFDAAKAPVTVTNFVEYANGGFCGRERN